MKNLLLLLSFCVCIGLQAQNAYQDVLYLKNGSIIRGSVLETLPNESIKIQTQDMSIFVYKMDEVEKITKELNQTASYTKPKRDVPKGYYGIFSVGLGAYIATPTLGNIELATVHGYRFNKYIAIGAGIAPNFIFNPYNALVTIPLFVDVRGNMGSSKIAPYWGVQMGPEIVPGYGVDFYFSPTLGVNISLPKGNFALGLSYIAPNRVLLKLAYEFGAFGRYNQRRYFNTDKM